MEKSGNAEGFPEIVGSSVARPFRSVTIANLAQGHLDVRDEYFTFGFWRSD